MKRRLAKIHIKISQHSLNSKSGVGKWVMSATNIKPRGLKFKWKYGGYHKIKHFACHRDFFAHEIQRIKHTQNAFYPGIKHFKWQILFSTNIWLWNGLYPGMKHFAFDLYVGFQWNHFMQKEISVTRIMFYFMVPPYY